VTTHEVVLGLHALTRWLVLTAAASTELLALHGLWSTRDFGTWDRRGARALVALIDLQISLGLTLYFLVSPVARLARADLHAAWSHPVLRFFGILHPCLAIGAALAAHAAWIAARRAPATMARHRCLALGAGAVLVLLAFAIPWPGSATPRPLLRWP
jgi:hypothetical protein